MTCAAGRELISAWRISISLRPQPHMRAWVLRVIVRNDDKFDSDFSLQSFLFFSFQNFDGTVLTVRGWGIQIFTIGKGQPYTDVGEFDPRRARIFPLGPAFLRVDRCLRRWMTNLSRNGDAMVPSSQGRGAFAPWDFVPEISLAVSVHARP